MGRSSIKIKKYPLSEKTEQVVIEQAGRVTTEIVKGITTLADRVIQASLASPYYSWATIALISAMGVRARLWSHDTSNLVTGTGLVLLGSTAVFESIPVLSGLSRSEIMVDNAWDESKVISPWAIKIIDKSETESWLKSLAEET